MKSKDAKIVKSILGEDIFDVLKKSAIYKPDTKSAIQPEEIRVALEIVPRSVLSFLFANLKYRDVGAVVELDLPWSPNAKLFINKQGADNYKGEVVKDGKRLAEFMHRSLPSIGLILLTTFELYDLDMLNEIKEKPAQPEVQNRVERLQDIIDERMEMHSLIRDVVDRRISEREAIGRLIKEKLNEQISTMHGEQHQEPSEEQTPVEESKKSKLRQFLENRERKRQESFLMDKSEDIKCPDCKSVLYKKEAESIIPCVCFGEFMSKPIKITKSEDGKVKIKFPKTFDLDNVEMMLDALKKQ